MLDHSSSPLQHGVRVAIHSLSQSDIDLNGATGTICSRHTVSGSAEQGFAIKLDSGNETVNVRSQNLSLISERGAIDRMSPSSGTFDSASDTGTP